MSVNFAVIGKRIQNRRKAINKTQENLAEYLGVSVGYVSLMECGKTNISITTLSKIADYLSCTIGELADNVSKNNPSYLQSEISAKISSLSSDERELLYKLLETYLKSKKQK